MSAIESAVARLPFAVRAQIMDEAAYDKRFWDYLKPLVLAPNPRDAVENEMKRAAINEMEAERFPESRGLWPVMRARFRDAVARVAAVARRQVLPASHEPGYLMGADGFEDLGLGPIIESVAEAYSDVVYRRTGQLSGVSDMAQWEAVAQAVQSLAPTAMQLYQQKLAKAKLEKQRKEAEKQAAAQQAQFQQTISPAARPAPTFAPPPAREEGIPWYVYVGGLVALLGLGLVVMRR